MKRRNDKGTFKVSDFLPTTPISGWGGATPYYVQYSTQVYSNNMCYYAFDNNSESIKS